MESRHSNYPQWIQHQTKKALKKAPTGSAADGTSDIASYLLDDGSEPHQCPILGFIVGGHKAIAVVGEAELKAMLGGLSRKPNLAIPCRRTIAPLATEKAIIARHGLKKLMTDQEVSVTGDGWTSTNKIAMMAVTAHWINVKWDLKSACFGVFELPGPYACVR